MSQGYPHVAVRDISYGGLTNSSITFMCNGKCFVVEISAEDFRGGGEQGEAGRAAEIGPLEREYRQVQEGLEAGAIEEFRDWVMIPCLPYFREAASVPLVSSVFTVQDFLDPPTTILKLANVAGRLTPVRCPPDPTLSNWLAPRVTLSEFPTVASKIRLFDASEVEILQSPVPLDDKTADMPRRVRPPGTTPYYMKDAYGETPFRRELDILLRIKDKGLDDSLRLPKLQGLVQGSFLDKKGLIVGLLLEEIEHKGTLHSQAAKSSAQLRQKWMGQIGEIVHRLHEAGIIWGDVKPENVLVDVEENAWVVDFGGGFTPDCVDQDKCETLEGDLQGLERIGDFLGVS